jgi:hypothetical protein
MKLADLFEAYHGDGYTDFTHLVRGEVYKVKFKTEDGKKIPMIHTPDGKTIEVSGWKDKRFSFHDLELFIKIGKRLDKAKDLDSKELLNIAKTTDEWIIVDKRGFQMGFGYPSKEEANKSELSKLGKVVPQKIE